MRESLTAFYESIAGNERIAAVHISLYIAILYRSQLPGGSNPVMIDRDELMLLAKIQARRIYNKCMQDLKALGYIHFAPSQHPVSGSMIMLKKLGK